jgi:hypothetical protein
VVRAVASVEKGRPETDLSVAEASRLAVAP